MSAVILNDPSMTYFSKSLWDLGYIVMAFKLRIINKLGILDILKRSTYF